MEWYEIREIKYIYYSYIYRKENSPAVVWNFIYYCWNYRFIYPDCSRNCFHNFRAGSFGKQTVEKIHLQKNTQHKVAEEETLAN